MLYSLNVNSIRDVLKRRGKRAIALVDLPKYTVEHLGLSALNLSTDLLAGVGRSDLEKIRDTGDRVGCTCLLLSQMDSLPLGDLRGAKADAGVDRAKRVITAATLLGCNSASISIKSKDTDENFDQCVMRMKQILEHADSVDINILIAPTSGLTEDPERLTQLIKGIGGFRIGTLPDFQSAYNSGDPAGYLRRLTPYASVVNATTLGFSELVADENAEKTPDSLEEGLTGLDALAAELQGMMDVPAPVHEGLDLVPMVQALAAVGFDGNIAIDYRGGEMVHLEQCKAAMLWSRPMSRLQGDRSIGGSHDQRRTADRFQSTKNGGSGVG
ncbi:MAG: TIM barrel protein [Phycisphaerales bacterium]|nr:TIM barrel protein [Phycisphaerales bacterium]